jgi:hypothetical protein
MKSRSITLVLLLTSGLVGVRYAVAGQAPGAVSDPDIPITHRDRVYSAEQFSNTVSVTDPVDNQLIGSIQASEQELLTLLKPCPDEALKIWPVDRMVGNVRNNGPQLILPVLRNEEVPA